MIKFSIIMLTYNHEKYIFQAIDSVLKQTYADFELIIIDDGSTDNTKKIIDTFNDSRIIYHHQQNQGIDKLAVSYNKALSLASGDYMCILEGDDTWLPIKLENQYKTILDNRHVDIFWSSSYYIDHHGNIIGKSTLYAPQGVHMNINDLIQYGHLYGNIITPSPTVTIRKSALDGINGFPLINNVKVVDYPVTLALLLNGGTCLYSSIPIACYRRHPSQATQLMKSALYLEHNEILKYFFKAHSIKFDIKEINDAIVWNKILGAYAAGNVYSIYKYIFFILRFNSRHRFKYLSLLVFGWLGQRNMYKIRELIRGKII